MTENDTIVIFSDEWLEIKETMAAFDQIRSGVCVVLCSASAACTIHHEDRGEKKSVFGEYLNIGVYTVIHA